ncbi:MAG: hypothetical protein QOG53_911 [Frankiales bacterium]|jgi:hypothetical protein|nr:hypothetical protein [Frankiales bacterium]
MTTESAFPFPVQGDAAAAPVEDAASGGNDRRKLLLAGAAVLLALVAAGYFLFLRGGSSDSAATPIVHHRTPTAAGVKAKAAAVKTPAKQTIPQTFDGSVSRDPFKPLVEEPAPAPAAGTVPVGTTPTSTASTPASQPVSLQKVYKQNGKSYAQLTVDGALYAPVVGQTFAQTFQLLSVSGNTATLVQGDEQFKLRVGQVVTR